MATISKLNLAVILLMLGACVVAPAGYYDGGPGAYANYGYNDYGPSYPWYTGVGVDIGGGWGHGGYGRGGYGGGRGGDGRSGGRSGGRH